MKEVVKSAAEKTDEAWLVGRDARVRVLEGENESYRKQLGMIADYTAKASPPPRWLSKPSTKLHTAVAVGQLSDTHVEEVVNPHELNGLNAYSREIAERRLQRWAHKFCELGLRFRHKWSGAILLLSGDIFSGDIHDELKRTNAHQLPDALVYWIPLFAAAIGQVTDFYGKCYVDCVVGNHGRLTRKPEAKGRARNNFDWALYKLVMSHFKNDDRVTFNISDAAYSFVPLPSGRFICHSHGDEVKGGNGVLTGIMGPLGRLRKNAIEKGQTHGKSVAYASVGHWHQTFMAHSHGVVCNGSMKGYDEYAVMNGFRPEQAQQNWWVETPDKGTVLAGSLFLHDQKKEGW